jgi:ABC-type glutathione transport system ATPase component
LEPLLRVENVTKRYEGGVALGNRKGVCALDGVSLAIYPQTTVALVGPSGSGKSTLTLCMALLEPVSSGAIWFDGAEVTGFSERQLRMVRPEIQLVFQDPVTSLNPRLSVLELVMEPLQVQNRGGATDLRKKAREVLERVGIRAEKLKQQPGELSGGQRQRVAIARALTLEPKVLILDEALSALDCSVQAQIANLLIELRISLALTCVFITHDLAMAAHLADDIAVMDHGRIVETGAGERVVMAPQHAVSERLLLAARSTGNVALAPRTV